jgi:hypothetical protein
MIRYIVNAIDRLRRARENNYVRAVTNFGFTYAGVKLGGRIADAVTGNTGFTELSDHVAVPSSFLSSALALPRGNLRDTMYVLTIGTGVHGAIDHLADSFHGVKTMLYDVGYHIDKATNSGLPGSRVDKGNYLASIASTIGLSYLLHRNRNNN